KPRRLTTVQSSCKKADSRHLQCDVALLRLVTSLHKSRIFRLFPKPLKGAKEHSPRRKPWVCATWMSEPRRGERVIFRSSHYFAPEGAGYFAPDITPRLAPWAQLTSPPARLWCDIALAKICNGSAQPSLHFRSLQQITVCLKVGNRLKTRAGSRWLLQSNA